MFSKYRTIAVAAGVLLVGLAATGKPAVKPTTQPAGGPATRPAIKQSGRLVKSIRPAHDVFDKTILPKVVKLNQTRLVRAGATEETRVKLIKSSYRCELTDARGGSLKGDEIVYANVFTLRSLSPESLYAFSFCAPYALLEVPHTFRLFTHGVGKNYLVWTANRIIFIAEVSKGNERAVTFMRHLCFHDPDRLARQKAIIKQMFGKKVKVELYDYLWRTQASQIVAQDFGLTSMPEMINTSGLIDKKEYGLSRNSIIDELFVISMSISRDGAMSLQFVCPKRDNIYTTSKKDGKWRLTGKETLTKKRSNELSDLIGN